MSSPQELSFLNILPIQPGLFFPPKDDLLFQINFSISNLIKVEKRIVTSLPVLFGDVGGLYGSLATLASLLVSRYNSKRFNMSQLKTKFLIANSFSKFSRLAYSPFPPLALREQMFSKLKWDFISSFKFIYWPLCKCCTSKKELNRRNVIEKGDKKLQKALDMNKLIDQQRIFNVLLRFKYDRVTRYLMKLQRQ